MFVFVSREGALLAEHLVALVARVQFRFHAVQLPRVSLLALPLRNLRINGDHRHAADGRCGGEQSGAILLPVTIIVHTTKVLVDSGSVLKENVKQEVKPA